MARLTKADVLHVAKLAKLDLSKSEVEKYLKQLSKIVDYISELTEVDTSNVEPTSQTTHLENVLREDLVKPEDCLSQEEAISGTEKTYNAYFVVPGILKEKKDK